MLNINKLPYIKNTNPNEMISSHFRLDRHQIDKLIAVGFEYNYHNKSFESKILLKKGEYRVIIQKDSDENIIIYIRFGISDSSESHYIMRRLDANIYDMNINPILAHLQFFYEKNKIIESFNDFVSNEKGGLKNG